MNMHDSYKKWLEDKCPKIYCQCICNGEIVIKPYCSWHGIPKYISGHNPHSEEIKEKMRIRHTGKHPSEETLKKLRIANSRENNPNWKGGITTLNEIIRHSNEYSEWRLQIFGRDNFTCQCCGIRGVYLEAHHIKLFSDIIKEYNIKNLKNALNCKLLWDLNNGITYCIECHNKLKKNGGLLKDLFNTFERSS